MPGPAGPPGLPSSRCSAWRLPPAPAADPLDGAKTELEALAKSSFEALPVVTPFGGSKLKSGKLANGPKGPPSAQFINPITMNYAFPDDVRWVPFCEGLPDIHFHTNYGGSSGQVVCSSSTLEFYKVNHDVQPEHVWNPERMNFVTTLSAIRRALASTNYRGRSTQ